MRKLLAAALLLAGCDTLQQKPPNLSGAWGGEQVGVVLTGGLGQVDYDCASGTIDEVIVPAKDGSFTVRGTHRTGQGGPVRVGQIFRSQRATYLGKSVKDDMTLTVTLEDGTVLGPYELKKGVPPKLTRCL